VPLLLPAILAIACGVLSPEEQLLTDFFESSRLYDTTAVSKIAAVTFNPRTDGVVDAFEVQNVTTAGETKRVTVRATVRQLDGATAEKTLVFTFARMGDRWFITSMGGP
jgi:hypothetical protein